VIEHSSGDHFLALSQNLPFFEGRWWTNKG
jgi:hypothetical protein